MRFTSAGKFILLTVIGVYISFRILPIIVLADFKNSAVLLTEANTGTEMAPFYWMVIIVGGCIAATLTYVSWRKYRGEKKKQMNKDSNS
ncbi:sporulation protein YpjB [Virgibacillus kekensis]|uniref:Sporulation protein YpjB n=1 Tax=Virgibacillus kekensis TaxID=202261 RepID=A0ABV9DEZ3_9BACI